MPDSHRFPLALAVLAAVTLICVLPAGAAHAQSSNPWPGFFQLEKPGHLEATLFGGGYASDKYGTTQEGFQLEQSLTRYVGIFGRATGYQLWIGGGFASPLNPDDGPHSRLNFGRLQAGVDLAPFQGTHLFLSGGHDVGDSDAYVFEGDFSTWLFLHSFHPVDFSFSSVVGTQNKVSSSEVDVLAIAISREKYILMLGGGGAIYGGGFINGIQGQGGPDVAFFYRPWRIGFSAQAGYGNAHQYGQVSIYKQFSRTE